MSGTALSGRAQGERQTTRFPIQGERHQTDRAQALHTLWLTGFESLSGAAIWAEICRSWRRCHSGLTGIRTRRGHPGIAAGPLSSMRCHQRRPSPSSTSSNPCRGAGPPKSLWPCPRLIGALVEGDGNLVGPCLLPTAAPGVTAYLHPQARLMAPDCSPPPIDTSRRQLQRERGRPPCHPAAGSAPAQIGLAVEPYFHPSPSA